MRTISFLAFVFFFGIGSFVHARGSISFNEDEVYGGSEEDLPPLAEIPTGDPQSVSPTMEHKNLTAADLRAGVSVRVGGRLSYCVSRMASREKAPVANRFVILPPKSCRRVWKFPAPASRFWLF